MTDTIKYLCDKYEIKLEVEELTQDDLYELDTYRAYKAAADLLWVDFNGEQVQQAAKAEVARRGWTKETLQKYNIGAIFDYNDFINNLRNQGFQLQFLREIDLTRRNLFSSDNLIFTWRDEYGRPIGFSSRNLKYEEQKKQADADATLAKPHKYDALKTTGQKCNIFQKNSRLYGLDTALPHCPPLWIFEGQSDVITAKQAGLLNCACHSGGILSEDQIILIKQKGVYEIILCPDGDEPGQKTLKKVLDERFAGHKDLDVKIVVLPRDEDPDSFIRKFGLDEFLKLSRWTAFEWRMNCFDENATPEEICKAMIPLIATEPSSVRRESLCRTLSERTDFPIQTIREDVRVLLDAKAFQVSKERETIIEKLTYSLRERPDSAEEIVRDTYTDLVNLSIKYNKDSFGADDFIQAIESQREKEETKPDTYEGFQLGEDLRFLQDNLPGDWTKDVFMVLGGRPNCGKSALFSKIAYSVAEYNEDVTVILHTIDDTRAQVTPRLVTIAEGTKSLAMAHVMNPRYWSRQNIPLAPLIPEMRRIGYERLLNLVRTKRLIVKDVNNGESMSYIESLIAYHSANGKVLYMLDNFHKLMWFENVKDARIRWQLTSQQMKKFAERYHVSIFSTVEYPKLTPGTRPNDSNIGETNQISYDANFSAHIYNDVTDLPDSFTVCHRGMNARNEQIYLPRIEVIIGKNKIASTKNTFFLNFYPDSSDYNCVPQSTVLREQAEMKKIRESGGKEDGNGDVFSQAFDR